MQTAVEKDQRIIQLKIDNRKLLEKVANGFMLKGNRVRRLVKVQ